jgi:hypothetical protein
MNQRRNATHFCGRRIARVFHRGGSAPDACRLKVVTAVIREPVLPSPETLFSSANCPPANDSLSPALGSIGMEERE